MRPGRLIRRLLTAGLIVGLVALNVATLTVSTVFGLLSQAISALDVDTVRASYARNLGALDAELDRTRADLETAHTERDRARSERDAARKDRDKAREERDRARSERDAVRNERDRARGEAKRARAGADRARTSAAVAKAHRQRLEREAAERAAERAARGKVVETTAAKVSRRMAIHAGRNASSTFLEAVPFVGIAAIVAVTAAEIYDACETAKEMAELRRAFGLKEAGEDGASEACGVEVPTVAELRCHVMGNDCGAANCVVACLETSDPTDPDANAKCLERCQDEAPTAGLPDLDR